VPIGADRDPPKPEFAPENHGFDTTLEVGSTFDAEAQATRSTSSRRADAAIKNRRANVRFLGNPTIRLARPRMSLEGRTLRLSRLDRNGR